MLQNIHSSRAVLAGIVFCVLIVGGSLIYSWYIRRTTVTAPTPSDALLHQRENQNEARTTADFARTDILRANQSNRLGIVHNTV